MILLKLALLGGVAIYGDVAQLHANIAREILRRIR